MKKLKFAFTVMLVLLIFSFCTTAYAQSNNCEHPSFICSECGKALIKCDEDFADCDNYYCPVSETCPDLKAHMQENIFFGILLTVIYLPIAIIGFVISIREIVKHGLKFSSIFIFAGDTCFVFVYLKYIIPPVIEGIKYFT